MFSQVSCLSVHPHRGEGTSVFGPRSLLQLLVPSHFWITPASDPMQVPSLASGSKSFRGITTWPGLEYPPPTPSQDCGAAAEPGLGCSLPVRTVVPPNQDWVLPRLGLGYPPPPPPPARTRVLHPGQNWGTPPGRDRLHRGPNASCSFPQDFLVYKLSWSDGS